MLLRVNIPSQVFVISLEREREREGVEKGRRRKINIKDKKENKEAGEKRRKEVPRIRE